MQTGLLCRAGGRTAGDGQLRRTRRDARHADLRPTSTTRDPIERVSAAQLPETMDAAGGPADPLAGEGLLLVHYWDVMQSVRIVRAAHAEHGVVGAHLTPSPWGCRRSARARVPVQQEIGPWSSNSANAEGHDRIRDAPAIAWICAADLRRDRRLRGSSDQDVRVAEAEATVVGCISSNTAL
jgi:hypothetical protein